MAITVQEVKEAEDIFRFFNVIAMRFNCGVEVDILTKTVNFIGSEYDVDELIRYLASIERR